MVIFISYFEEFCAFYLIEFPKRFIDILNIFLVNRKLLNLVWIGEIRTSSPSGESEGAGYSGRSVNNKGGFDQGAESG